MDALTPLVVAFVFLPVIGAVHGWLTNLLAIRLLFRPRSPVRVLGFTIQGALPRRRQDLAAMIGQVVERDLVSVEELVAAARVKGLDRRVEAEVEDALSRRLDALLPRFVPGPLREAVRAPLMGAVLREVLPEIGRVLDAAQEELVQTVRIGDAVRDRLIGLDLDAVESLVVRVAGREIRAIEIFGLVMGFGIGLVQGVFLLAIGAQL